MVSTEDRTNRTAIDSKGIDFVYYTVSDITVSVSFYRDTLGLTLEVLHEGKEEGESGYAEFAAPPTTFGLSEETPQGSSAGGAGAGIALAVDDVETAVEELRNQGISVHMEPLETGVCHMAIIADPDDNHIMLHRRNDGTHGRVEPFQ